MENSLSNFSTLVQLSRSVSGKIGPEILGGVKITETLARIIPYALTGNTSKLGSKLVNAFSSIAGQSIGKWIGKLIGGGLLGGVAGIVLGGVASNLIGGWLNRVFGIGKRKPPTLNLPLSPIVNRSPNADRYTLEPKWNRGGSNHSAPAVNIQLSGIVGNEFEVAERIADQLAQHLKLRQLSSGSRFGGS